MKITLKLFFGRRHKMKQLIFCNESISLGQMSLYAKFHYPSPGSFLESYEENFKIMIWKMTKFHFPKSYGSALKVSVVGWWLEIPIIIITLHSVELS